MYISCSHKAARLQTCMSCAVVPLQISAGMLVMQHQPIAVPEVLHDDMNASPAMLDYDGLSFKPDGMLECAECFAQNAAEAIHSNDGKQALDTGSAHLLTHLPFLSDECCIVASAVQGHLHTRLFLYCRLNAAAHLALHHIHKSHNTISSHSCSQAKTTHSGRDQSASGYHATGQAQHTARHVTQYKTAVHRSGYSVL